MTAAPAGGHRRSPGQDVVHLVRGLVLVHGDLLDDDLAFGIDIQVGGPQHHVLEHVERALQVHVEEARVDRGGLLAGAGVDLRPHRVEQLVDLERAEAVRALEQEVLQEMRDARLLVASRRGLPVRIQNPSAIERAEGTASVTTRRPESSVVSLAGRVTGALAARAAPDERSRPAPPRPPATAVAARSPPPPRGPLSPVPTTASSSATCPRSPGRRPAEARRDRARGPPRRP